MDYSRFILFFAVFLGLISQVYAAETTAFNSPSERQNLIIGNKFTIQIYLERDYGSFDLKYLDLYSGQSTPVTYTAFNPLKGHKDIDITLSVPPSAAVVFVMTVTYTDEDNNFQTETYRSRSFVATYESLGDVTEPSGDPPVVAGRESKIKFEIKDLTCSAVTIGLFSRLWDNFYMVIKDNYKIDGAGSYEYTWQVPATVRLSPYYSVRIICSSTEKEPYSVVTSTNTGSRSFTGPEFAVFSITALKNSAMDISIPKTLKFGETVSISWSYTPPKSSDPKVRSWTIELLNAEEGLYSSYANTIASNLFANSNSGSYSYKVPESLTPGLYIARIWGYNTDSTSDVDPISGMTGILVVTKDVPTDFSLSVTSDSTFTNDEQSSITISKSGDVNAGAISLGIYKGSTPYLLVHTILRNENVNNFPHIVNYTPLNLTGGNDYYFVAYSIKDQSVTYAQSDNIKLINPYSSTDADLTNPNRTAVGRPPALSGATTNRFSYISTGITIGFAYFAFQLLL